MLCYGSWWLRWWIRLRILQLPRFASVDSVDYYLLLVHLELTSLVKVPGSLSRVFSFVETLSNLGACVYTVIQPAAYNMLISFCKLKGWKYC